MSNRNLKTIAALMLMLVYANQSLATRVIDDQQTAAQYKPGAEQMIIDGLIYRPLSLAGTAIGTGIFIVTLPFSILGGNVGEAGKKLVIEPALVTFGSCLGCIQDYTLSPSAR